MMNNAEEPAISITGLHVRRGRTRVLRNLHVDLPRGSVTGLLGPSGSGKTTLLRAIVGLQRLHSGTVTALGHPAGSAALRQRVGYATQEASVYRDLTVEQNLRYFARILGAPTDQVSQLVAKVGLQDQRSQAVGSLSGGQRNRVSLAAAMLGSPELLVLDEPTVGLDPLLRAELWELLRAIAADGTTLLLSSHVMDEALRCDRLLLLREGRLLADTTPAALLADTGTSDPDAAFLALIRREAAS